MKMKMKMMSFNDFRERERLTKREMFGRWLSGVQGFYFYAEREMIGRNSDSGEVKIVGPGLLRMVMSGETRKAIWPQKKTSGYLQDVINDKVPMLVVHLETEGFFTDPVPVETWQIQVADIGDTRNSLGRWAEQMERQRVRDVKRRYWGKNKKLIGKAMGMSNAEIAELLDQEAGILEAGGNIKRYMKRGTRLGKKKDGTAHKVQRTGGRVNPETFSRRQVGREDS